VDIISANEMINTGSLVASKKQKGSSGKLNANNERQIGGQIHEYWHRLVVFHRVPKNAFAMLFHVIEKFVPILHHVFEPVEFGSIHPISLDACIDPSLHKLIRGIFEHFVP
jgi:hypothetical protein